MPRSVQVLNSALATVIGHDGKTGRVNVEIGEPNEKTGVHKIVKLAIKPTNLWVCDKGGDEGSGSGSGSGSGCAPSVLLDDFRVMMGNMTIDDERVMATFEIGQRIWLHGQKEYDVRNFER